ncbi:hypothetical protein A9Z42_0067440 [Trichoderma parareesei]|uniref:Uncharacterized protein n=1 Tax=Trichoderma parareesei TaxID=858221 RepID=A0A2H3A1S9_TRIPA|nr:hypothetical protein A9Z42_0067440 [Trichoderma parareesei]
METPSPVLLNGSRDEGVTMRDSPAAVVGDSHPIADPITENGPAPGSARRPSYTPQFSSASWILSRIKDEQQAAKSGLATGSEAATQAEDGRKDGLNERHGSSVHDTLPMPLSSAHKGFASVTDMIAAGSQLIGVKRKREAGDEGDERDDFSQNTIALPIPAPTPAVMPSTTETPSGVLSDSDSMCSKCERRRAKNLAALPEGVVPAKPELVGFWAGQASDAALTEYFYGKKKTDLLNVLSFCDQLKPQLLVDIMVSVAKKHPELPIFDSPSWNTKAMSAISVRSKHSHQSKSTTRLRHGHTVLESRIKHKHKVLKKTIKQAPVPVEEESPSTDYQDALPPLWPKAGEGLYAKLRPEDEDRAFLLDENDEEAFSHFGVDKFGKQISIPVSV